MRALSCGTLLPRRQYTSTSMQPVLRDAGRELGVHGNYKHGVCYRVVFARLLDFMAMDVIFVWNRCG